MTAQHGIVGSQMYSPVDVSYLADTVVLLRYYEAHGRIANAVSVLEKRSGQHDRALRAFEISSSGARVGPLELEKSMPLGAPDRLSGLVLVYAPMGRDRELAARVSQQAAVWTEIAGTIGDWCGGIEAGAASVDLTDKALTRRRWSSSPSSSALSPSGPILPSSSARPAATSCARAPCARAPRQPRERHGRRASQADANAARRGARGTSCAAPAARPP